MEKVPIRREGLERLQNELKQLKTVERPAIIRAIAEARVLQQQRDFFQESTKEALSLVAALTERYITSSSESGSLETG